MFSMDSENTERDMSGNINFVSIDKKKQSTCFSPVVMVLQPGASPSFRTPLRCKDFYSNLNALCRICHEEDTPDSLISPCNCMGSLGYMHKKCLEKWLSMSNTNRCEICRFRFHVTYHTRHFGQWLLSGGIMGPKGLLGDVICLIVLLPLSVMSIYLCAFGARNYMHKLEWQATGLALLCLFLVLAFILWSGLTFRFHFQHFRHWQSSNLIVRVVESTPDFQPGRNLSIHGPLDSGHYSTMSESALSFSFDVTTVAFNTIIMTETRL